MISNAEPASQPVPANDDGAEPPDTPREPAPPSTRELPDLPAPQEVGEDG
ncbi:hypothetical protein LJ656_23030 [Paraburkholderia sp. MMS20-SJTR3]|uniref:Stereocilin n=1 Tax=Paraburkholderia sejongensis TaxID=2886946 RepID=A0ABS8JZY8_9BURK|nr:hypothetical protein [Paraburkholderia sp. MMS20-SJTR3]MCC8395465.1 hypothetical protein [Paraburkholderia sp. MMS20-SJTR3]